jgi:hypothetical protein
MSATPWDHDTAQNERQLARQLVEMVRGAGRQPATFDIEFEGAKWEVAIREKHARDAPDAKDRAK